MSYEQSEEQNGGTAEAVFTVLVVVIGAVVLAPLVLPWLLRGVFGMGLATKWRFWTTPPGWGWIITAGVAAWAALVGFELVQVVSWFTSGGFDAVKDSGNWGSLLGLWPWWVVNLLAGALLLPAVYSIQRRKIRAKVRLRRLPDVSRQEQVELAIQRAGDFVTAKRIGVTLDVEHGGVSKVSQRGVRAPLAVEGDQAFGVRRLDPVRNVIENFHDKREVDGWMSSSGAHMVLPRKPASARALLIAESGSGKTELFNGWIAAAAQMGWRAVFIDGKGDPHDAERTVQLVRGLGKTARVAAGWNLFSGTAEQITGKIMRLWPSSGSDGDFYRTRAERALRAIQAETPVRSVDDLRDRLFSPAQYVADRNDASFIGSPTPAKVTLGEEVWNGFANRLAPLVPYLDENGWTFHDLGADVLVIPLSPIDPAQKVLGDLMLFDLRNYLADRMRSSDRPNMIGLVDEFAQLVGEDVDAGDSAASLFETCRSAGMGLVIGAQSVPGLSQNETTRQRLLSSGAALIVGRSKDPEAVSKLAGTKMHLEASGAAEGSELRGGRSQHTFVLPPGHIRDANVGAFWMVQAGAVIAFRALLPRDPQNEYSQGPRLELPDKLSTPERELQSEAADDTEEPANQPQT